MAAALIKKREECAASRHPGGLLPVVQRALGLAEFVSGMSELARQAGAVYTGMP